MSLQPRRKQKRTLIPNERIWLPENSSGTGVNDLLEELELNPPATLEELGRAVDLLKRSVSPRSQLSKHLEMLNDRFNPDPLTYAEIAAHYQMSRSAARNAVTTLMKRLRDTILLRRH